MAHNPILNAYRLKIKPTKEGEKINFIDLMRKLSGGDEESGESQLFMDFFALFLNQLKSDEFIKDAKRLKAFTGYNLSENKDRKANINPDWDNFIIEGIVDGGRYGQSRNVAKVDKKTEKSIVERTQIITDQYYFYLYIPLDSDLAVLIMQSYTEDSIADVFLPFVKSLMQVDKYTYLPEDDRVVPKSVIDKYMKNSKIKSYKYIKRVPSSVLSGNHVRDDQDTLTIKIEISSREGKPLSKKRLWRRIFGNSSYVFDGKNQTPLSSFDEEKAVLEESDSKRMASWDIKRNIDLEPTQYLENIIDLDQNGIPNFTQLKEYCSQVLEELKPEIYGSKHAKRPNF